jgi:hypothetical protein
MQPARRLWFTNIQVRAVTSRLVENVTADSEPKRFRLGAIRDAGSRGV